jgi:hypothetical protein
MENDPSAIPAAVPGAVPVPQITQVAPSVAPLLCSQCHQPVQPEWYYCPNCGKKLTEPPLPTDLLAQILLYAFSIILPVILYLAIRYWQGIRYVRSKDPKAQSIGWIAIALIILSTIITGYYTTVWINQTIQSSLNDIGNLGGL